MKIRLADFIAEELDEILAGGIERVPWELIPQIDSIVSTLLGRKGADEVFIHSTAKVEDGAVLKGPVYISAGCFVAAHAYLRQGVFLGRGVSVGPSCELKTSLVFSSSRFAHFNFIGDSIIGSDVNFEAGAHTANHWNERQEKEISVSSASGPIRTGLQKFGAIIGDNSRIGANAVLSPGTLLPRGSIVERLTLIDQTAEPR